MCKKYTPYAAIFDAKQYKLARRFFKSILVTILSFRKSFSQNVKYTILFNLLCQARPTAIDSLIDGLSYYIFLNNLDGYDGSFNTLAEQSAIMTFDLSNKL